MSAKRILLAFFIGLCLVSAGYSASKKAPVKKKILVVDSYHREYGWSQDTNKGFCSAMLKFGYFDSKAQADEYTKNDYVETAKVIVKKLWMDAKRKNAKSELSIATMEAVSIVDKFKPDLIFLGDDDAVNYIGNQFIEAEIPVIFWGVDNTPVKYGLVDSIDKPGHNVTGIYQSGYYIESLELLKAIAPGVKTFAVLSDATSAGRNHVKAIEYLSYKGNLPLKLAETVSTNDFELWKQKALELQNKVDAFYVVQYSGLEDEKGNHVSTGEVAKWYLTNCKIPEASRGQFVKQGMLCAADDSGYNQGYEAVVIGHDVLSKGANPAAYAPRTPKRGALMVNRQRAEMLGITIKEKMGIEEYIEKASVLSEAEK